MMNFKIILTKHDNHFNFNNFKKVFLRRGGGSGNEVVTPMPSFSPLNHAPNFVQFFARTFPQFSGGAG